METIYIYYRKLNMEMIYIQYIYIYYGDLIWTPNILDLYIYLYALMEKSHIYNNITVCIYLYIDNKGSLYKLGLHNIYIYI